jgi:hypothetical protein
MVVAPISHADLIARTIFIRGSATTAQPVPETTPQALRNKRNLSRTRRPVCPIGALQAPASLAYLRTAGMSNRAVAEARTVVRVGSLTYLLGRAEPSPRLRAAVSRILGLPEELLFRDELQTQGPVE